MAIRAVARVVLAYGLPAAVAVTSLVKGQWLAALSVGLLLAAAWTVTGASERWRADCAHGPADEAEYESKEALLALHAVRQGGAEEES